MALVTAEGSCKWGFCTVAWQMTAGLHLTLQWSFLSLGTVMTECRHCWNAMLLGHVGRYSAGSIDVRFIADKVQTKLSVLLQTVCRHIASKVSDSLLAMFPTPCLQHHRQAPHCISCFWYLLWLWALCSQIQNAGIAKRPCFVSFEAKQSLITLAFASLQLLQAQSFVLMQTGLWDKHAR